MSFVIAAPDLVEAAAQDLASIRSALSQAAASAAGPTTGVVAAGADEVSLAISQLFGAHGQEFQLLSAQATAFHDEFVNMLNAGAAAYSNAEATGTQLLASAVNVPAEALFGQPLFGGAATATGLNTLAGNVAAPYQTLLANTTANLQSLNSAVRANPAPFLQQLVHNQMGYGQAIGASVQNTITNLPTVLADLPSGAQAAFQSLLTANPAALINQVATNQAGFAHTISSALHSAGQDLNAGLPTFQAGLQTAFQQFSAGNVTGAMDTVGGGLVNLLLPGFDVTTGANAVLSITPIGPVGDLLPIFAIPGQMAQNFTNLLPAGSIPAMVSQNFTNLVQTATNTSVTSTLDLFFDPSAPTGIGVAINANMGLPLALGIDALGGPVNALNALGSSTSAFVNAVQTGDTLGAATAFLNAPAVVADGFLNGHTTFPLTIDALGIPTTLNLPLDGILVPPGPYTATIPLLGADAVVSGTPLGGIVPALLGFLPEQLAEAIGAAA
ncbi:PE domain-containing protein [Mycobacterium szulgai]|uniref:PE domain-containing protein n=1 Tax=Mycobacterium szulgai TaxID=1787 RepID=A0A1X2EDZ5_MYCSZ|nr:PE domain-containing protein [Mycobacterium szulgai]MCV7078551.1 PE family protein [Mycobacterium szulgai]ORW98933.1 hypothetical protein AWC27_03035 [Mycobacterium szulgai]